MAKDLKRTIRVRGAIKVVVGIVMLALVNLVIYMGAMIRFIGGLSLIIGISTKIISICFQDKEKKMFWAERTKKLMYFGGVSFIGGFIAAIPFLAGAVVVSEGGYNIVMMKDSYGIIAFIKMAGKFMENFVGSVFRARKSEKSDIIDVKIIEEKKPVVKKKPVAKKKTSTSSEK
jgi:dipeptide/tripeptide permease